MSEENIRRIFAQNLSYYKSLHNLSNVEISKIAGVSESAVGKWLKMKATPRMGAVEKLAQYFGINKSDLLEEKKPNTEDTPPKINYVPETIAAHFEGKEFSEEDLSDIARFIDFVASKKRGGS